MAESTQNLKTLERKSLILSVLLHVLVFGGLVITFPVKDVGHKPLFVFLGSILDRSDFSRLPSRTASLGEIQIDPEDVPAASRSSREGLLPGSKPPYSRTITPDPKQLTKSNFLDDTSARTAENPPAEDQYGERNPFDYRPLSLQGRR